jgi:TRAP-type uncharacterized transport system substrate-binding protein
MKKVVALIMVLAMIFALAACGTSSTTTASPSPDPSAPASAEASSASAATSGGPIWRYPGNAKLYLSFASGGMGGGYYPSASACRRLYPIRSATLK